MEPLTLASFPRAIVHIDGDAFFASCEQSRRPKLQGRPVVTGKERGIAASMSYEAKARGVTRGMRISEIRAVYLSNADKYRGLTRRPPQGHKGLDERALMASQRPLHPW